MYLAAPPSVFLLLLGSTALLQADQASAFRFRRNNLRAQLQELNDVGVNAALQKGSIIYVPYKLPGVDGTMYWNSKTQECSFAQPPTGAKVASMALPFEGKAAALLAGKQQASAKNMQPEESVPVFPNEKRTSCKPHCTYKCDTPVCEADCKPVCEAPLCKADCEKTDYDKCKVECGKPQCAVYCPAGACCEHEKNGMCKNGTKEMNCDSPACETHCDKPKCVLNCPKNEEVEEGCKTTCEKPKCEWSCKDPTDCPKPKCEMVCEVAPECTKNTSSEVKIYNPKLCDPDSDPGCAHAKEGCPKWQYGEWSECKGNCSKGTRTRTVTCPTGNEEDCSCKKMEATIEPCETGIKPQHECGPWPACPSDNCEDVTVTRECNCGCPGECGEQPETKKVCPAMDKEPCRACLTDAGNGTTGEGSGTVCFTEGEHGCADFEHEVKKDVGHPDGRIYKLTALSVEGCFCKAKLYEYCDFNEAHEGWDATFTQGEYSGDQLARVPDDCSGIKVWRGERKRSESSAMRGTSSSPLLGLVSALGLGMILMLR